MLKREVNRIRLKYPDRVPAIVNRNEHSIKTTPEIDRHKYLVPMDLTVGQFQYVIRKRIKLSPDRALFLFINSTLVCNSEIMGSVYEKYKSETDGFLHVVYSCESTFG